MSIYGVLKLARSARDLNNKTRIITDVVRQQGNYKKFVLRPVEKKTTFSWKYILRRWGYLIPLGTFVVVFSRRSEEQTQFGKFTTECYCHLPLRITSRVFGWIASIPLPEWLRPAVYNCYASLYAVNLQEIDRDLSSFPSLVDFFVRPLREGVRPIAQNTNFVSPSDGKVLHFGPVTSCAVEQVKGMTYNLQHFLGDVNWSTATYSDRLNKTECNGYIASLLKNPTNQLYQLVIYLAPGHYHRFHSPTDWRVDFRRHFQGKLLSVSPRIAGRLPDLFSLNERAVYIGEWSGGFMALAAVGATNVGSIKVYCDSSLCTNTRKWPNKICEDANICCSNIAKGELFGEFRMGSTIVLLFEAPKDFKFSLKPKQFIKVGQALTEGFVEPTELKNKTAAK